MHRHGFTLIELMVVVAIVGILAAIVLPELARARETANRAVCQNNLKQFGIVFRMYAGEHGGQFPPAGTEWIPDQAALNPSYYKNDPRALPDPVKIFPDYLTDPAILICPSRTEDRDQFLNCPQGEWCNPHTGHLDPYYFFDKRSYLYFGYCVATPAQWLTMAAATTVIAGKAELDGVPYPQNIRYIENDFRYTDAPAADFKNIFEGALTKRGWPANALTPTGTAGTEFIYRLREGVERFLITDINNSGPGAAAQSQLAVMWDHIELGLPYKAERLQRYNHAPGGVNALYMDGHVEWLRYPAEKHPGTRFNAIGTVW